MPIPENRTTWPHADPVAAADHIADHAALAVAVNTLQAGGVGGTTDHNALTNLTAGDPHTQYALDADLVRGAIRKTANQTMTATAQTAVTDMSFPVVANATYYFAMTVRVTTSTGTAPTSAWGLTGPAGATVAVTSEQDVSTTQETKAVLAAFGTLAAGAQVANTGAEFRGVIVTAATAGTVQLTVARAGTTPSMVVAAGSNGFYLRLA